MPLLTKKPSAAAPANGEAAPKISKKAQAEMDKPFTATLPGVDLLSAEVQQAVEQQRLKRLFVILGAFALIGVVAVWLVQAGMIAVAQNKLEVEQGKAADLAAQQAALADVQVYYGQVAANTFSIQSTMSKEVLVSEVLSDLNRVTPAGISLTNVGVVVDASVPLAPPPAAAPPAADGQAAPAPTAAPAPAAAVDPALATPCPSQDPYALGSVSAGCVTVDGTASSRALLGDWLDRIDKDKTFTVAFIPSTTSDTDGGGVTFSATIGLDAATVYLNRYSDLKFLKAGAN